MSIGRIILKTLCAGASVVAICAGSVAAIAPAVAATSNADSETGGTASDSPITVTDAVFDWGVNPESGGGSYFGGCNALSAGTAGDAGKSAVWTASSTGIDGKALYRTVDESAHAEILKPSADGTLKRVDGFSSRCTNREGTDISGATGGLTFASGSNAGQRTYSENIVRLSGGTGTIDAATKSASLTWKGASFTIAYYGGLTYWSISDPTLTIVNGKGTLTGRASGYGADMNDPGKWEKITSATIHLADFATGSASGADPQIAFDTDAGTITAQPDYLGVRTGASASAMQAAKTSANAGWWGAFPQSWVSFNMSTGQSSYWFTTSGDAASIQPRKVASPITVSWKSTSSTTGTRPGAPTLTGHDTAGADRVEVFWKAPDDQGDPAYSGFVATARPKSGGSAVTATFDRDDRSGVITGLKSSTVYEVTIAAVNALGSGGSSNTLTITTAANGTTDGGSGNGTGGNGGSGGGTDSSGSATYRNVTLRWGLNDETNSASYYGVCNFMSAGKAGNTGGAKVWASGFYKAKDGNVSIEKPDSSGKWVAASWESRCLARDGSTVTMQKRADGRAVNSESQVVLSKGSGVVNADGSVRISWSGSFTVAYYGGMTYWSVSDPKLTLDASGNGSLTATASGYGADMNDAGKWVTLSPRTIHLADFRGVDVKQAVASHGFTKTPEYLGVKVTANGSHGGQAAKDATNAAYWGSFPQSFVDFQVQTGQSAYWYTANSQRDFAKVARPLSVQYDSSFAVNAPAGSPTVATSGGGALGSGGGGAASSSGSGYSSGGLGGVASAANAQGGTGDAADGDADGAGTGDGAADGTAGSAAGDSADSAVASAGSSSGGDGLLIADNARTIALGSGSVAVASALPLGAGWFIRRRLGLDPGAALDERIRR
ncbi:hypothetical protein Uis1B_1425 [Bifidobacterium margollesii]|uniref:Fibronectin type-III domain-containing protein n=1 Tax=Bifidobacterium margollesii TaxID=2020964 RepID=A0A2N5J927_9BIFI|nr:fibronectin type III domain-containing protein [Bifidobacterium margollesii]PLS30713.1 hypothetical protein Uis1B_1425 [Bifidobacterium margollesii]